MLSRVAASAAVLFTLGAVPASTGSGTSFVMTTTASSGEGSNSSSSTRVQAMNGVLRFDAVATEQGRAEDSYVLVNPSTKLLSIVMPGSRQYLEMNFGDSVGQAMAASAQLMASSTIISDIQVAGTSLGSGGTVNGHLTKRYRINTSYTQAERSGEGSRKYSSIEEFWVTNELEDIPDPMEAFTRAFGGRNGMPAIGGSLGELIRQRGDAQRKLFTGLPIRSVVRSTIVEADGSKIEETTTTDVTELKRVDLDPSVFQVPAGYTKLDPRAMLAGAEAQMRDAFRNIGGNVSGGLMGAAKEDAQEAVEETKQEAKDATKDAVKDKAKCALGGVFGRKKC